jgi:hypothetical protein
MVCKYSARYSYHVLMKLQFSRQIFENTLILNFMTFRPVGAELLQAKRQKTDRQTDRRDEANGRFPQNFEHTSSISTVLTSSGLSYKQ